jgi:heat shock protein HslJ
MLAVTACGSNGAEDSHTATSGVPSTGLDFEEHEWVLDRSDSSLTVEDDNPVTLSVTNNVVSGLAPCNAYHAPFRLGDGGVKIGDVALTLRACDESTMRAEDEFVAALEAINHVSVSPDGDRLTLTGEDVRLTFRAYDADELLIGTWDIVNVATGTAIESVLPDTHPTVTFEANGDLILQTGCNTANSSWELDGHQLTVGPLGATLKICPDPPGLMDQEAALLHALKSADRVEITPRELVILNAEGLIVLDAVRA